MPSPTAYRLFLLLGWLLLGGLGRARAQSTGFSPRVAVPPDSLHLTQPIAPLPADSLGRRFDEARVRLNLQRYTRRGTIVGRALAAFFSLYQAPAGRPRPRRGTAQPAV